MRSKKDNVDGADRQRELKLQDHTIKLVKKLMRLTDEYVENRDLDARASMYIATHSSIMLMATSIASVCDVIDSPTKKSMFVKMNEDLINKYIEEIRDKNEI